MRKITETILILASVALCCSSCKYLDIAPEFGLPETAVFSNYANFKAYLESAYNGDGDQLGTSGNQYPPNAMFASFPTVMDANAYRYTMMTITDACDAGRYLRCHTIKSGTLGQNASIFVDGRIPIIKGGYKVIRICNNCIEHIDILQDASQEDKDDMMGQAYFLRAYEHMNMCNYFGGMAYIDHVLQTNESWDVARMTASKTYERCAEDFELAYSYFVFAGKERRDASNHLQSTEQNYPGGVAAKAMKARALLYAASPLNNPTGDPKLWEAAAQAAADALQMALNYEYELIPFSDWKTNCVGAKYTNEQIWAWNLGSGKKYITNSLSYPASNSTTAGGEMPTQQTVDLFETIDGYPLATEEQRAVAIAAGSYKDQDPYSNRDPRFYVDIIYDGAVTAGSSCINIHYDPVTQSWPATTLDGRTALFGKDWGSENNQAYTSTGYYAGRKWDGKFNGPNQQVTDPLIRLAELYLNYAEAVNEAYGPNESISNLPTAVAAVNLVRGRVGMPDIRSEFTGTKEALRERIRNERMVEFLFEDHHYYIDTRRWKTAPERMSQTLMGMRVEKTEVSAEYPRGRKYIRTAIPVNRQSTWTDAMYYFFLPKEEANKMFYFENNQMW